jgi:hypothetical protein
MEDGAETDVDCGGTGKPMGCAPCGDGQHCQVDTDCQDQYCKANVCTLPTCIDMVQDGNETDVDCGGTGFMGAAACPTCANGKKCEANGDCTSGWCDSTQSPAVCITPTCSDGKLDGDETDIDCGGGSFMGAAACPPCAVGKTCNQASDCTNGFCQNNKCALKTNGTPCGAGTECASSICGTTGTGHCCSAACSPVFSGMGTCGATDCDGTGACVFPPNGIGCGSCPSPGSIETSGTCNGSGTCVSNTVQCADNLTCSSNGDVCNVSCGPNSAAGDANCVAGFWCDGMGGGACLAAQGTGAMCTRNAQCANGPCGGGTCP